MTRRSKSSPSPRRRVTVLFLVVSSVVVAVRGLSTRTSSSRVDVDALAALRDCGSATRARAILSDALPSDDRLFGSGRVPPFASARLLSDAEMTLATGVRGVLDRVDVDGDGDADRASLAALGLVVGGTVSAVGAERWLPGPEILRWCAVWLSCFAPLILAGAGLAVPRELQGALSRAQAALSPSHRRRAVQHEAGHFLVGHLLGLPVRDYRADDAMRSAVEFYPLRDDDRGRARARGLGFDQTRRPTNDDDADDDENVSSGPDPPYFSEGGRGAVVDRVAPENVARDAWPYRRLDDRALDALAAAALAGVAAEILAYGDASGGRADLTLLEGLCRDNADEDDTPEEVDAAFRRRVRFGLSHSFAQLRRHLGALDALAEVMGRGGGVDECVAAIETCGSAGGSLAREEILLGLDYETVRRRRLYEAASLPERIWWSVFRRRNNLDNNDDDSLGNVIEGKGGGDQKPTFAMTGDDPLYAAGAAAFAFFLWAANGGLSLH